MFSGVASPAILDALQVQLHDELGDVLRLRERGVAPARGLEELAGLGLIERLENLQEALHRRTLVAGQRTSGGVMLATSAH
jgi:hypothetical protein